MKIFSNSYFIIMKTVFHAFIVQNNISFIQQLLYAMYLSKTRKPLLVSGIQ